MTKLINRFIADDDGGVGVEYIAITGLLALGAMTFFAGASPWIVEGANNVNTNLIGVTDMTPPI